MNDLRASLCQRLGAATIERVINTHDQKLLGIMVEPDGRQFVSRTYEPGAELEYEQRDMSFLEALEAMIEMYRQAGIDVVSSSVVSPDLTEGRVTVLSEYLPDAIPLKNAPIEAKREASRGLARLLDPSTRFLPSPEALVTDMFMAQADEEGSWHPIVVDVDPRIKKRRDFRALRELEISNHIFMSKRVIQDGLSESRQEAADLATAFLRSLDPSVTGSSLATMDSLMDMHSLTQEF